MASNQRIVAGHGSLSNLVREAAHIFSPSSTMSVDILILVLLLTIVTFLVWKFWNPIFNPPKRSVPEGTARLSFFFVDWCGWCKKTMPEWEKLEQKVNETPVFGQTRVKLVRINAEEERKLADLYEADAYPTILLETKDALYRYEGKRTADDLFQFLRETLGKERASL